MAGNTSKKAKIDKKNSPSDLSIKENAAEKCAGCGAQGAEFSLDDRQLCLECYQAEKRFWDKDQTA
jgi:hypothetical protein